MIFVFSVRWRLHSIGITEKNKARAISWSDDNDDDDDDDDDDDRNIYLLNEYL